MRKDPQLKFRGFEVSKNFCIPLASNLERGPSTRTVRVRGTLGNRETPFVAFPGPSIPHPRNQYMSPVSPIFHIVSTVNS